MYTHLYSDQGVFIYIYSIALRNISTLNMYHYLIFVIPRTNLKKKRHKMATYDFSTAVSLFI